MKGAGILFPLCSLCLVATLAAGSASARRKKTIRSESASTAVAQDSNKLVYADFETMKENRVVSNRGGQVHLFGYQESPTVLSRVKGQEGTNPPAPEVVRLKKDDPNHAITFEYELPALNQYAGAGVEIQAQAYQDGKPVPLDVSSYKNLMLQLYVTGVTSMRVEFFSRGQGINITNGSPQMSFKVKPGLNTYQIPLKSLSQPPWTDLRVAPNDLLKKLTAIQIAASCGPCTTTKGVVVVDNLVFQN